MESKSEFVGECLCGAVRFAAIPPSLFCAHCHCDFCRRAHGAAFVTWFGVPEGQFTFLGGNDHVTWYASSKQGLRGFCVKCGSTLFYKSSLSPGEVHIALANMKGSIDRPPDLHVFFDAHVDWFEFHDDLPRLDKDSELLAHYKQVEV
jgi:hypothetical protein